MTTCPDGPRAETVVLVLAEAARMRAEVVGGRVVAAESSGEGECQRCGRNTYVGQTIVRTRWTCAADGRTVTMHECAACCLEAVLSGRTPRFTRGAA